jgi:hypothetical protein
MVKRGGGRPTNSKVGATGRKALWQRQEAVEAAFLFLLEETDASHTQWLLLPYWGKGSGLSWPSRQGFVEKAPERRKCPNF